MAFEDTPNKQTIRIQYDLPILEQWQLKIARKLSYFGLTGPEIRDLRDWQNVLDRCRTAVESPGKTLELQQEFKEAKRRMMSNVMNLPNNGSSGFQLLEEDIENIIIHGTDRHGTQPSRSDRGKAEVARFSYDLINFDFDGGLGYTNGQGKSKRVEAIKKLFERQQGSSFLLLLTINLRHTLKDEFDTYLMGMRNRSKDSKCHEMIDWYLAQRQGKSEFRIKATVPSFIQSAAEHNSFKCYCRPPVFYIGHKNARMLHFVFELESQSAILKAWSEQDDFDLLTLPLLNCNDGHLEVANTKQPGFDLNKCKTTLNFLSEQTVASILLPSDRKNIGNCLAYGDRFGASAKDGFQSGEEVLALLA